MASVYRGVQKGAAGFKRPVAIKRTHRHLLETPKAREMILREAENASAVRHPNVVSIDDVEEVGGELVMKFVEGTSLSRLLKATKLPISVVLAIVIDACAGVHAIHAARGAEGTSLGLVHRDISPQNVVVGLDGLAKVTDFGIAKRLGDPKMTSKNMRRGKFGYMAPEYILSGNATPGADVFALGVILWEALAGRRLFDADTKDAALRKNFLAEVPALHPENSAIPAALDEVLQYALAYEPIQRCPSADELATRIRDAAGAVATRAEVARAVRRATSKTQEVGLATGKYATVDSAELELVDEAGANEPSTAIPIAISLPPAHEISQVRASRRPTRPVPAVQETPSSGPVLIVDKTPSGRVFRSEYLDDSAPISAPTDDAGNFVLTPAEPTPPKPSSSRPANTNADVAPPTAKPLLRRISLAAVGLAIVGLTAAIAYAGLASEEAPVVQTATH